MQNMDFIFNFDGAVKLESPPIFPARCMVSTLPQVCPYHMRKFVDELHVHLFNHWLQ